MAHSEAAIARFEGRQADALVLIRDSLRDHGRPPTLRELREALDVSSTSVMAYTLQRLERDGYVARDPIVSRGLRLTPKAQAWLAEHDARMVAA